MVLMRSGGRDRDDKDNDKEKDKEESGQSAFAQSTQVKMDTKMSMREQPKARVHSVNVERTKIN
jgi:hypothetical protein